MPGSSILCRLLSVMAVALLASCAQQPGAASSAPAASMNQSPWVFQSHDDGVIAAIGGKWDGDPELSVICNKPGYIPAVIFIPETGITGRPFPELALSFDGAPPDPGIWSAVESAYGVITPGPAFDALIAQLKSHREATFVLTRSGKEVARRSFSLEGAAGPIDRTIADCKARAA